MKRLTAYLLITLVTAIAASAQGTVDGRVTDATNGEPLTGASVVVKSAGGKLLKYAVTKAEGRFSLQLPTTDGCRLDVTMMGYEKQSLPLDSVTLPLTIGLTPGSTLLREVTVKADRIREQGDTVSYNVGSFAREQDRSIGDVLKRIPGIDVAKSGKIQYQGEDINKFYIEGSDLLGGKYGIATNGISHEDVGSVEVMENHQPMQVLSGIAFSDKAAINLKLKKKAKAAWSAHGDVSIGLSQQPEEMAWDGQVFVMAVKPSFQNITTLKTNNTGTDLSTQATDYFAPTRGTDLQRYIGVSLPGVPGLDRRRTLFNRSALVSTNNLWKLGRGELKVQFDYSFSRLTSTASSATTYYLDEGDRVVTEERAGTGRIHALSGRAVYEHNGKTAFINNTLRADVDFDNTALRLGGSLTNSQNASMPDYYVANEFKMIKRFGDRHLVTLQSTNEWESLPQSLAVVSADGSMRQSVRDHAFATHESAAYTFLIKAVTVSLQGGIKALRRSMNSGLTLPDNGDTWQNVINTNSLILYATPKMEYRLRHVNLTLDAPVSLAHYTFDKSIANRSEFFFSPSLSLNYKPNNRVNLIARGGLGSSPMSLGLIHPDAIMTDSRTFRTGVDDFYRLSSQNISASVAYKHARRGVFANAFVMQSWNHTPYTLVQNLVGDYAVYSYASTRSDSRSFMASGNVGKTLDFMRGSANLNGSFSRNETHLLSEQTAVDNTSTRWSAGLKINGAPLRLLSIDYRFDYSASRLMMNSVSASWLSSMENELTLNIMPGKRWEWHIGGEHYRNELAEGKYKNVVLLDTRLIYKPGKRIELKASLTNILNRRTYSYRTYSQLSSFESRRHLRGREFLITLSIRK